MSRCTSYYLPLSAAALQNQPTKHCQVTLRLQTTLKQLQEELEQAQLSAQAAQHELHRRCASFEFQLQSACSESTAAVEEHVAAAIAGIKKRVDDLQVRSPLFSTCLSSTVVTGCCVGTSAPVLLCLQAVALLQAAMDDWKADFAGQAQSVVSSAHDRHADQQAASQAVLKVCRTRSPVWHRCDVPCCILFALVLSVMRGPSCWEQDRQEHLT